MTAFAFSSKDTEAQTVSRMLACLLCLGIKLEMRRGRRRRAPAVLRWRVGAGIVP